MTRVGTITYATDQGIAHLSKNFYDAGLITDVVIFHHSSRTNRLEWYPAGTQVIAQRPFDWPEIKDWLASLDCLLQFETPFDWQCLKFCRQQGVKTVVVPMYECTPRHVPVEPDLWACPSLLDLEVFTKRQGAPCCFAEIPLQAGIQWQQRTKAERFLHNSGHLGLRGHKGTLEILQSLEFSNAPFRLTVRCQDKQGFAVVLGQCSRKAKTDPRLKIEVGSQSWGNNLFDGYDVFIMAEKYNGLSLPLREARAAGLAVMTSDRFPMNTWLPQEYLIPVSRYEKAAISGAYLDYNEAVIDPRDIAAKMDSVFGQDITETSLRGREWAQDTSWDTLRPLWESVVAK